MGSFPNPSNPASKGDIGVKGSMRGSGTCRDGRHNLESESLQHLDGIVGWSIEQDATVRKARVLPFAPLSAVAEQAIFKCTVDKQFSVKSYRLLAVHFFLDLFHGPFRSPSGISQCGVPSEFAVERAELDSWTDTTTPTASEAPNHTVNGLASCFVRKAERDSHGVFTRVKRGFP